MVQNKFSTDHWPTEIRYKKDDKTLEIDFDDGVTFRLRAEFLRVESPSAEVQGHNPDDKITVPGCRHVGISSMDTVGNYAIRIHFDDTHNTGIFTWSYLYELGQDHDGLWLEYLDSLTEQGLSRDP
ncbi:MAG: DUF971 domain-containing protein [Alphaproteobacteria bacterium]|nr:DUF971 domain-containing protein [Alphaproteobacteria bacterium]